MTSALAGILKRSSVRSMSQATGALPKSAPGSPAAVDGDRVDGVGAAAIADDETIEAFAQRKVGDLHHRLAVQGDRHLAIAIALPVDGMERAILEMHGALGVGSRDPRIPVSVFWEFELFWLVV